MILFLVDVIFLLQINLDLTEWENGIESAMVVRHDCLDVSTELSKMKKIFIRSSHIV